MNTTIHQTAGKAVQAPVRNSADHITPLDRALRVLAGLFYAEMAALPVVFTLHVLRLSYPGQSLWQAMTLAFHGNASLYATVLVLALSIWGIRQAFKSVLFLLYAAIPRWGNPWREIPRGVMLFLTLLLALPGLGILTWYAPTWLPAFFAVLHGDAAAIPALAPLCMGFGALSLGPIITAVASEGGVEPDSYDQWQWERSHSLQYSSLPGNINYQGD